MNILLQAMYFHPEVGSMEVHVLNLARYFVKKGHTVEVVTSNSLNSARTEVYDGISIIRTPFFGRHILGRALTAVFSVPQFLRRTKYADIIHADGIGAILPCALAKATCRHPSCSHFSVFTISGSPDWHLRISKARQIRFSGRRNPGKLET